MSLRCGRGGTVQRLIHFQQRAFVQRDQTAPRSVDVDNQGDDDRDEKRKNESLKNRVTAGSSRLVADQPQAAPRNA